MIGPLERFQCGAGGRRQERRGRVWNHTVNSKQCHMTNDGCIWRQAGIRWHTGGSARSEFAGVWGDAIKKRSVGFGETLRSLNRKQKHKSTDAVLSLSAREQRCWKFRGSQTGVDTHTQVESAVTLQQTSEQQRLIRSNEALVTAVKVTGVIRHHSGQTRCRWASRPLSIRWEMLPQSSIPSRLSVSFSIR